MTRPKGPPRAFGIGEAVAHRLNQGFDAPLNWEQTKEAVEHPLAACTKADLVEVVAYLGAQLVGSRTSVNQEAALAMAQIRSIVREFDARGGAA